MEGQPSVEELLNIITLQRKALEFYANDDSYKGGGIFPLITLDNGSQARFALKQSNIAMDYHDSLLDKIKEYKDELDKNSNNIINENSLDDFKQMVESLKKLKDGNI